MAPTAVAESATSASLRALAERHGLHDAGARPGIPAYLARLWKYRHFIGAYSNARVSTTLSQTRLGRMWQVLTPLTNAAVYFLIFGVILDTKRGIHNFIAYLCVGVFMFSYTQGAVQNGIKCITDNLGLIRALHFPRASLPIATTMIELQHMAGAMAVLMAIVLISHEPLSPEWLLAIPTMLLMTLFNAGLALFMARVGSKLIDLRQLVPFILRFWMYFSGVLYDVHKFAKSFHGWKLDIVEANPLMVYIELMRNALMEHVPPLGSNWKLWVDGTAWAILSLTAGFVYFWRGEMEYGRG